ncbi:hypothetical protein [Granulicella sp. L60]|uniref:hypothetical protein n=1 Tax=Granulicella sp. L60 TaxID=1641866 RepID=UPI00131A8216|nr:hypothetical protein [Granulicella sp. L60]
MARDKDSFHLTGLLHVPVNSLFAFRARRDTFFDLEAALTFCEQQHVALSNCSEVLPGEDPVEMLLSSVPHQLKQDIDLVITGSNLISRRPARPTSGHRLQFDAFLPDMRVRFLNLAIERLGSAEFQAETGFRSAFFRHVEVVKMGAAPIDVTFSLVFTGLELLARMKLKPTRHQSLSWIMKTFLDSLGFTVSEDEARQFAQCRNALFHRGELHATYHTEVGGEVRSIKITELPNIRSLFPDVLLKVLGFNDPRISSNRWRDRMAFKGEGVVSRTIKLDISRKGGTS